MNSELKTNTSAKSVFSKIGLAAAVMSIVVNVVQVILAKIFVEFTPKFASSGWVTFILVGLSFYCIGAPIFYLMVKGIPEVKKKEEKKFTAAEVIKFYMISFFVMIILNLLTQAAMYLISIVKGGAVSNPIENVISVSSILATIIFAGVLSPIVEEVVFRGIMLNKLRRYGDKVAIITTALMFGLFHENFAQFFYATGLGIIFAYVAIKSGTIKYSIILHILINMTNGVIGTAVLGNNIATTIYGLFVIVFFIAGLILFIKDFKKASLIEGTEVISKGTIFNTTCLNVGMILNFVISVALMIFIIVH